MKFPDRTAAGQGLENMNLNSNIKASETRWKLRSSEACNHQSAYFLLSFFLTLPCFYSCHTIFLIPDSWFLSAQGWQSRFPRQEILPVRSQRALSKRQNEQSITPELCRTSAQRHDSLQALEQSVRLCLLMAPACLLLNCPIAWAGQEHCKYLTNVELSQELKIHNH